MSVVRAEIAWRLLLETRMKDLPMLLKTPASVTAAVRPMPAGEPSTVAIIADVWLRIVEPLSLLCPHAIARS